MKRVFLVLLVLSIFSLPGLAQEPTAKPEAKSPEATTPEALPSIDQILDKLIEGAGGKAAIEKITSRQVTGEFEIAAFGVNGTLKAYSKAPNKNSSVADVPGVGLFLRGFDGTVAWEQDPNAGLHEIAGAELAARKRDADFHMELHIKDLFPKLAVKAKQKVGEKEAYLVEATPAEGNVEKLYFDVKSGLLIRHDAERDSAQGVLAIETYFDDYRDLDGIKVPFSIKQVNPAFTMSIKITEVKHNVEIDVAKFAKPAAQ